MSTRGAFGVLIDGVTKVTYNHSDSYPECLGRDLADQVGNLLNERDVEEVKELARNLRMVEEDEKPTSKDKELLKEFTNLGVGDQSDEDWYCLTRDLQGQLDELLKVGVMTNGVPFLKDSLFCESHSQGIDSAF